MFKSLILLFDLDNTKIGDAYFLVGYHYVIIRLIIYSVSERQE